MENFQTISSNGQVFLGEDFAGKNVVVDEVEPGVWMIKTGEFIPDSEKWIQNPDVQKSLHRAMNWASKTPAKETKLESIEKKIHAAK